MGCILNAFALALLPSGSAWRHPRKQIYFRYHTKHGNHQRTMVDPYKMVDIRYNFRIIMVFTLHVVTILFYLNDLISGFLLGSNSSQFSSQVHISRD